MVFAKNDFSTYKCSKCGTLYEDRELRARISLEERMRLFNNVIGIKMHNEFEEHPIDKKYIKYEQNPDAPNIYDAAMSVEEHLAGLPTKYWY
jgi:hypothetical protein